jgi:hypothetical protein
MLGAGGRRAASRPATEPKREREGGDKGCQQAAERHHEQIGSTEYRHRPFRNQLTGVDFTTGKKMESGCGAARSS